MSFLFVFNVAEKNKSTGVCVCVCVLLFFLPPTGGARRHDDVMLKTHPDSDH